jgi:hypothetical protein
MMDLKDKFVVFCKPRNLRASVDYMTLGEIMSLVEAENDRSGVLFRGVETLDRALEMLGHDPDPENEGRCIEYDPSTPKDALFVCSEDESGDFEFRPATPEEIADPLKVTLEHMIEWMRRDGEEFVVIPAGERERVDEELELWSDLDERDVEHVRFMIGLQGVAQ